MRFSRIFVKTGCDHFLSKFVAVYCKMYCLLIVIITKYITLNDLIPQETERKFQSSDCSFEFVSP